VNGPFDDAIDANQGGAPPATLAAAQPSPPERPPGGKAFMRLLQLVESAGYGEAAVGAVEAALEGQGQDPAQLLGRAALYSASPRGETLAANVLRAGTPAPVEGESVQNVAMLHMEVAERLGPPTPTGPQWQSLGPLTVTNGQTYGTSRVNVSGRVSAIAVDPNNPAHVLVGAANGGVWESQDRGASWAPRTDYAATLTVGAIAFARANPTTVYCGTGEGNWWSYLGAGVLRSTDGGTTWTTRCTAPFVGQGFYDLIVDPADGQHLLAGTTGGLYVSTDGGVNWTRRRTPRTWSLAIHPAGGAAAEILAACSDGLFRSTDGGNTWTAVSLPGSPGPWNRLAVAIAPSNPAVAYVWGERSGAFLWRRSGGTWASVTVPPGVNTSQGWYDWFLAVAPDRDSQIYCGAIEVHRGDLAGSSWTWLNLTNKGATGDSIHPDQHAIAFEPGQPNTIYVGNDGGLFRSANRGINWQHCNNGLVISEFEYLAQNANGTPAWLIGGTQDNGTNRLSAPGWEHVADGDGGDCGVNRTTPNTVFHTYYGMSLERSTTGGGWGSWSWAAPPVPTGEGSLFYPPFECSAPGGDTVALGGDALYVSRNNGAAWVRLAFPSPARSSALYIPDADNVYVGTSDGRAYRTQWNGASWTALTALATPRAGAFVSDLLVQPAINRVWATYRTIPGPTVFRSDDGGASWVDRTPGLPALPMNAVEVDPTNADRVWVAADLGVYQSLNGGGTWADFASSLPNMYVGDLVLHPQARLLRAATRNRGIWEIAVAAAAGVPAAAAGSALAGYILGTTQYVSYLGNDNHVHELWWDGTSWHHNDLTLAVTGGPAPNAAAGSALAGSVVGSTQHVIYLETDNHVHELWWDGTNWHHNDLTLAVIGGPAPNAVAGSALAAYVLGAAYDVIYQGADNHVHELWWDGTNWHHDDLTLAVVGGPAPNAAAGSALAGYILGTAPHVIYRGTDNHVRELWWDGANWNLNDLTLAVIGGPAPNAAPGSALAGYVLGTTQHVIYLGTDNHVRELWWDGTNWNHNDLTLAASGGPAPNAAPGSALAGYVLGTTQHVIYRGTDNHVRELWWDGSWHHNDLTLAVVGGPAPNAAAGSHLDGYILGGTQHVNYLGTDNHVHELWWDGAAWRHNDLVASAVP